MVRNMVVALALLVMVGCGTGPTPPHYTVAYESSSSLALMDVYHPDTTEPTPGVVFIHGGAFYMGSRGDAEKYASVLVGKGLAVIAIDYRMAPAYNWPAPLDDCQAALRYVRANMKGLGLTKVAVMGASCGACLAQLCALQDDPVDGQRPDCLVAISGYGNMELPVPETMFEFDMILGQLFGHPAPFSSTELNALSPALMANPQPPSLVLHSVNDGNVYIQQGDAFAAAMQQVQAPITYMRRDGYAHGDDLWLQDGAARQAVAEFLLNQLR